MALTWDCEKRKYDKNVDTISKSKTKRAVQAIRNVDGINHGLFVKNDLLYIKKNTNNYNNSLMTSATGEM